MNYSFIEEYFFGGEGLQVKVWNYIIFLTQVLWVNKIKLVVISISKHHTFANSRVSIQKWMRYFPISFKFTRGVNFEDFDLYFKWRVSTKDLNTHRNFTIVGLGIEVFSLCSRKSRWKNLTPSIFQTCFDHKVDWFMRYKKPFTIILRFDSFYGSKSKTIVRFLTNNMSVF